MPCFVIENATTARLQGRLEGPVESLAATEIEARIGSHAIGHVGWDGREGTPPELAIGLEGVPAELAFEPFIAELVLEVDGETLDTRLADPESLAAGWYAAITRIEPTPPVFPPIEPRPEPRVAALCMSHNESEFLPVWVGYYTRELGAEHVYVLDHGSDDGSAESLGCQVLRVPRDPFDEHQRTRAVSKLASALLEFYDLLIYGDADEVVVPDPNHFESLIDLAARNPLPSLRPYGVDVTHEFDEEPALDFSRPLLAQRRYWRRCDEMMKPVITRRPLRWETGFHSSDLGAYYDPRIFLIHLKYIDLESFVVRFRERHNIDWHPHGRDKPVNYHWKIPEDQALRWFKSWKNRKAPDAADANFLFEQARGPGQWPMYPITERFKAKF